MSSLSDFICCSKCESVLTREDLEDGKCPDCGNDTFVDADKFLSSNVKSYVSSSTPTPTPQNIPKCPICGSTNLSKITIAQKAGKIALFGIFGMGDNGKTWKCNNCGSKF